MAEKTRKRTPEEIRREREAQILRDEEALAKKRRKLQVRDAKEDERAFIVWLREEMIAGRLPVDHEAIKEALTGTFSGAAPGSFTSESGEPPADMFDPMVDPAAAAV